MTEKIVHHRFADLKGSTDQELRLFSTARVLGRLKVRVEHTPLRCIWCLLPVDCKYTERLSLSMESHAKRWAIGLCDNVAVLDGICE